VAGRNEVNSYEQIALDAGDAMARLLDELPQAERPIGAVPLSADEQLLRWQAMRDDKDAWSDMIASRGLKPTLDYAKAMLRLEKKHGTK
jgi:hypothetical protein